LFSGAASRVMAIVAAGLVKANEYAKLSTIVNGGKSTN